MKLRAELADQPELRDKLLQDLDEMTHLVREGIAYARTSESVEEKALNWRIFLFKLIIAVLTMSAALIGVMTLMPDWEQGDMLMRMLRLAVVVVAGVVAYFGMLGLLGFRPREFARRLD